MERFLLYLSVSINMYWKINFILLLFSVQCFGYTAPKLQDIKPSSNISKNINNGRNQVLDVLKKVYSNLNNVTDAHRNNLPNTYGLSLQGHHGFVWNMLNNASKHFAIGAKGGDILKNANKFAKHPIQQAKNCHPNNPHASSHDVQNCGKRLQKRNGKQASKAVGIKEQLTPEASLSAELHVKPLNVNCAALIDHKKEVQVQHGCKHNASVTHDTGKVDVNAQASNEEEYLEVDSGEYTNEQIDYEVEEKKSLILQLIEVILSDEQFWEWLVDWTDVYVRLLDEHIQRLVTEEVGKQIRDYFDRLDALLNDFNQEENKDDNSCDRSLKSHKATDFDADDNKEDSKGLVSTQNIRNSSVYNEYTTNVYVLHSNGDKKITEELGDFLVDIRAGNYIPKNQSDGKSAKERRVD